MVSDYLKVVTYFLLFFTNINFFHDFIFHESEIRTVLLEVSIDLGLLKKSLLKTSKIVLMYSNSLTRHFSSIFHAKCLLLRLDRLLLVRSCLQNFYQCSWANGLCALERGQKRFKWNWVLIRQPMDLNLMINLSVSGVAIIKKYMPGLAS